MAEADKGGGEAALDAELFQDVLDVAFHGVPADAEDDGDLGVCLPLAEPLEDFALALAEAFLAGGGGCLLDDDEEAAALGVAGEFQAEEGGAAAEGGSSAASLARRRRSTWPAMEAGSSRWRRRPMKPASNSRVRALQ